MQLLTPGTLSSAQIIAPAQLSCPREVDPIKNIGTVPHSKKLQPMQPTHPLRLGNTITIMSQLGPRRTMKFAQEACHRARNLSEVF